MRLEAVIEARGVLEIEAALLPIADVTETFIFALVYRRIGTLTVPARQLMNIVIEMASTVVNARSTKG